jgi:cytochrome bd ubiquinol oxidase subunit I
LLAGFAPHYRVVCWTSVPASQRPPLPTLIHLSFDVMVFIGTAMLLWGLWLALWWWRRRDLPGGRLGQVFLVGGALSGVASVVAMEAGWVVTEVGRQPWVVYRVLRTSQAVTTAAGVPGTLVATLAIYAVLTVATFSILRAMKRRWDSRAAGTGTAEPPVPYSPPAGDPAGRAQ